MWRVQLENGPFFHSAITPDLFEIFLESLATLPTHTKAGPQLPDALNYTPRKHISLM